MNVTAPVRYPNYEDHQQAWEELAKGIAALKTRVRTIEQESDEAKGELTIIGSGIETIGFSVGDQKLIEAADKVLYCVADPATVVWLTLLRPDALDLYVLYGENKVRYITYMQMAEAQLYWVRQGLKVVVVFYGHPGVFVLSTHRAIKLARREGHRAVMKAGVCALDTLCADLGVDPSHPGLQTHEATDSLIRQRHIDTSLHVILWQVGLIGELGYRRNGYLNDNFSYFIRWLQELYDQDYEITHYIGSRYPTIDPLIQTYRLDELHNPNVQSNITGLSTFYIPPRDVVATDHATAMDLGLLREGQRLVTPSSPLREIDQYGPREMAAFTAFENFRIPTGYRWQEHTEASNFLIELRFDTALQDLYSRDPQQALNDSRFNGLSDKERALLSSRDPGAVQIAAKGIYKRSSENEQLITRLLNSKVECSELLKQMRLQPRSIARAKLLDWAAQQNIAFDAPRFHASVDFIYQNNIYPWTGVYLAADQKHLVTLLGNQTHRNKSILYIDDVRVRTYQFQNGMLKWSASESIPFSGILKFDHETTGLRRMVGKIWSQTETAGMAEPFVASEVDPARKLLSPKLITFYHSLDTKMLYGTYAVRASGRFVKEVIFVSLSKEAFSIDGQRVDSFTFNGPTLSWRGGIKSCFSGRLNFLIDPIAHSVEAYGQTQSNDEPGQFKCYGTRLSEAEVQYGGPPMPDWAQAYLLQIVKENETKGGLMLWHKWEKYSFTNLAVVKYFSPLT